MKKDYEEMLEGILEKPPKMVDAQNKFEITHPEIQYAGRRTVIVNFREIEGQLGRDPEQILKFLVGEMATRGNRREGRAAFHGRFNYESIKNLLEMYTKKYAICPVSVRPDTNIEKEKRRYFLKCKAWGHEAA